MSEQTENTDQVEPTEVEELTPTELIEILSEDLTATLTALKRIVSISPAHFSGGPNNKSFGKRFEQAFEKAQKEAFKALVTIDPSLLKGNHEHQ